MQGTGEQVWQFVKAKREPGDEKKQQMHEATTSLGLGEQRKGVGLLETDS